MSDLFNMGYEDLIEEARNAKMKTIRLLSLFSGIGAFEKALDNCNIPYELVAYCEIDKYASKAYSAIHGVSEDKNLWDVCNVDATQLKDIDLISYGFPCQDISISGKMQGMFDDEGGYTRSGLFFEALRIIKECRPRIAIAENVRNLMSETFRDQYHTIQESLDEAGYTNHVSILNAKDYGIPQNRERVFIISIRKDIDMGYIFPTPVPLKLCLKDLLEDKVDEKYYLSAETVRGFEEHRMRQETQGNGFGWSPTEGGGICQEHSLQSSPRGRELDSAKIRRLGNFSPRQTQSRSVYDSDGLSPTLCSAAEHGNIMPYVAEPRGGEERNSSDQPGKGLPRVHGDCLDPHVERLQGIRKSADDGNRGKRKEGVIVTEIGKNLKGFTDTATTLMARDYKGLHVYDSTAVMEFSDDG